MRITDLPALAAALEEAIAGAKENAELLNALSTDTVDPVLLLRRFIPGWHARIEKLAATLRNESELAPLDASYFVTRGSAFLVSLYTIAEGLALRAISAGTGAVAEGFARLVADNAADAVHACAVVGVAVDEAIQLPNGICIVPFDHLSSSYGSRRVKQLYDYPQGGVSLPPLSILTIPYRLSPVFVPKDTGSSGFNFNAPVSFQLLEATVRCLILSGPRSASMVGIWDQVLGDGYPAMSSGAMVVYPMARLLSSPKKVALDRTDICNVVSAYQAVPQGLRDDLHIPIDRLSQAISEMNVVDRAIDLGIALESLLLHGPDSDRGELGYRLQMRGAALLGGNVDERVQRRKLLRDLYSLRSTAVHAGHLPNAQTAATTLDQGTKVCETLIRKILQLGSWPDWEKLILAGST